eukprot:Lithocolla_globosa_v1_NODE_1433_length_2577_cov_7.876685.p2 type:complete len:150 gc:universal NODE_1433_length_2577_cov_7.876685:261-710(+)
MMKIVGKKVLKKNSIVEKKRKKEMTTKDQKLDSLLRPFFYVHNKSGKKLREKFCRNCMKTFDVPANMNFLVPLCEEVFFFCLVTFLIFKGNFSVSFLLFFLLNTFSFVFFKFSFCRCKQSRSYLTTSRTSRLFGEDNLPLTLSLVKLGP